MKKKHLGYHLSYVIYKDSGNIKSKEFNKFLDKLIALVEKYHCWIAGGSYKIDMDKDAAKIVEDL